MRKMLNTNKMRPEKVWKNYAQGIQKHLTTTELSVSVNSD